MTKYGFLNYLKKHIQRGDVIYDIGAHICYTSLLFARYVGSTVIVHAFEILPSVAEQFLKKIIQAKNLKNIIVHDVGLSDREQIIELPIGDTLMTSLNSQINSQKKNFVKLFLSINTC